MKVSIASGVGPDSGRGDNHCYCQLASKIPPPGKHRTNQGLDQAQHTCLGMLTAVTKYHY